MDMTEVPDGPSRSGGPDDLYDPVLYRLGRPHAIWRRLRAEAPVVRHEAPDGTPFWSLTRYQDVVAVLKDTRRFTSRYSTMLDFIHGDVARDRAINVTDGARHRALRPPTLKAMAQPVIAARTDEYRTHLRRLVAGLPDGGPVDLVPVFSVLPMVTTGRILGITERFWSDAVRWAMVSIAPGDPAHLIGTEQDTLRQAHLQLFDICSRSLDDRRQETGGDVISMLRQLQVDGAPLSAQDVLVNFYASVMGATVTTPQVMAHLVSLAAAQPDLWRRMRADRDLVGTAVEEALRWASPISHLLRQVVEDTDVGGIRMHAGDLVACWVGSANRDESVFDAPYTFDPARRPNPHVAFGSGPHFCVGSFAARAGVTILLEELLEQISGFEPAGPVTHLQSNFIAGVTALPVLVHRDRTAGRDRDRHDATAAA
jgi:cytochrome P450